MSSLDLLDMNNPLAGSPTGGDGMDPITGMAIGAGLSGIGSYFQGDAEKQAAAEAAKVQQEQLDFQKQQFAASQQGKVDASGIINSGMSTTGIAPTMDYTNPLAATQQSALTSMMTGQLTPAQQAQMQSTIASANQNTNAVAASSGMPAGARAAMGAQNTAAIGTQYGNIAANEMTAGVQGATAAGNLGLNVASTNNQSALTSYLNQQQQQNLKAQTLAGYAT